MLREGGGWDSCVPLWLQPSFSPTPQAALDKDHNLGSLTLVPGPKAMSVFLRGGGIVHYPPAVPTWISYKLQHKACYAGCWAILTMAGTANWFIEQPGILIIFWLALQCNKGSDI